MVQVFSWDSSGLRGTRDPERLRGGDSRPDEGAGAHGWPAGPAFRELSDMSAARELHDFVGLSLDGLRLVKKRRLAHLVIALARASMRVERIIGRSDAQPLVR